MLDQPEPWDLDPWRIVSGLFREQAVTPRITLLLRCAFCRLVWDRLIMPEARILVEVTERYAEGTATDAEWEEAQAALRSVVELREGTHLDGENLAASMIADQLCETNLRTEDVRLSGINDLLGIIDSIARGLQGGRQKEWGLKTIRYAQLSLIRCLIPENRNPLPLPPDWLTSTVTDLATLIYTDRAFDRMPILADALEDAGCDDRAMLTHCRNAHRHARGCWVLDRILGKN